MENRFRFRAWNKKENKMCNNVFIAEFAINDNFGMKICHIDDVVLMQSTGLTDSEGKDIFEKDILTKDGLSFVVEFIEGGFVIKQLFSTKFENGRLIEISEGKIQSFHEFNSMKEYKIVGNSFENKELLGE